MTLTELFKNSIEHYANKPALCMRPRYRTVAWKYRDLGHYANNIAKLLEKEGVKAGDAVLLWANNSPYWVAAFFGILLRGGVVVPLHAENTPEFMQKVATQTNARFMLKSYRSAAFLSNVKEINIDSLVFENKADDIIGAPSIKESDIAEIIYTSGTTGDPKGVILTHKNIAANIESLARAIPIGASDCFLSILPLSHMFEQTTGMLFPLSRGAQIIYIPRVASGPIMQALREHRATKLCSVPQFLDMVMKKIETGAEEKGGKRFFELARRLADFLSFPLRRLLFYKIHKQFGGKLRTVASGGAPLDQTLEKKWELLGFHLLQGYGLTETAPVVSTNAYHNHRFGSVGKPLEGIEVKIASDGEILVKGANVFPGYYQNKQKTDEAFTSDGWFKTDDIGELDKDGFLYIKGRKKYMILGPAGQNIYPEDIEFELNKQPGARDSAVVGLERERQTQICAVLLLEPGADADVIIENANKKLADFQKIQTYRIWTEEDFPRSATKKVQKEKVLTWLRKETKDAAAPPQPATPLTKILGGLFEKDPSKLSRSHILVSDLGLDSILRIELITRIEEVFGVSLEERLIAPKTSIGDLEVMIQQASHRREKLESRLKKWPFSRIARIVREMAYWIFTYPLSLVFMRPRVFGIKNLEKIEEPFLIMPNHRSYFDSIAILAALPRRIRKKLAIAAATDVMKKYRLAAPLLKLFYASFPFPRKEEENIEAGLRAAGLLLDKGWSVMVFPEGKMSKTRELLPLKRGAGLLAVEMDVPVIPVYMDGAEKILPYGKIIPRCRKTVKIYFGALIRFPKTASYIEATETIQQSINRMQSEAEK